MSTNDSTSLIEKVKNENERLVSQFYKNKQ